MYKANITKQAEGSFYALIVRIDKDSDYENVIHNYKGRTFKTKKAAIKSTNNYLAKLH